MAQRYSEVRISTTDIVWEGKIVQHVTPQKLIIKDILLHLVPYSIFKYVQEHLGATQRSVN